LLSRFSIGPAGAAAKAAARGTRNFDLDKTHGGAIG